MNRFCFIIKIYVLFLVFFQGSLQAQDLKVFILAGQSNMEGQGQMYPMNVNGTLSHFMANDQSAMFSYIQNPDGSWATREDVWVRYDHGGAGAEDRGTLAEILNVGLGEWEEAIGPELGFGHVMGDYFQEQVLVIKTCWGGKSLAVDFRPPGSGGTVGPYYIQMIADINAAINNVAVEFPQYTGGQIEIAGFCWFQGWNDGESTTFLNEYEQNLKNLIQDVRSDLNSPDLPFVVGLTGNGGKQLMQDDAWVLGLQTILVPAQINAAESPEFINVTYADTRDFWMESDRSPEPGFVHHWYNNAESYLRIGHELGIKIKELLDGINTSTTQVSKSQNINIYPCPTAKYIQIRGNEGIHQLEIWDLNGRLVKTYEHISRMERVDISDLNSGVYFGKISALNGRSIIVRKIIKK